MFPLGYLAALPTGENLPRQIAASIPVSTDELAPYVGWLPLPGWFGRSKGLFWSLRFETKTEVDDVCFGVPSMWLAISLLGIFGRDHGAFSRLFTGAKKGIQIFHIKSHANNLISARDFVFSGDFSLRLTMRQRRFVTSAVLGEHDAKSWTLQKSQRRRDDRTVTLSQVVQ